MFMNRLIRLTAVKFPSYKPSDRIGLPYVQVDPKKIIGVVEVNTPDQARSFTAPDPITDQIGQNVADFLAADMKRGIIPASFLPLQSGVGTSPMPYWALWDETRQSLLLKCIPKYCKMQ